MIDSHVLSQEYGILLREYLAGAQEVACVRAYELGRTAVESGLGVLKTVAVHQEAMMVLLRRASSLEECGQIVQVGATLLAEVLGPFDTALRGCQEANVTLSHINETLERRTAQLAAANKELETFAYTVSHDLKAPLRGMEGFARALQEDYADRLDEAGRHFLDMVQGSAQRMGALIDNLLQYSRVERRAMRWEPIGLEQLLGDLMADRRSEIEARGVRIERNLPVREVAGEREGLQQALANLLDNALKFTRKVAQPTITITTRTVPNFRPETRTPLIETFGVKEVVEISVADNGVGFDPKYREKAFAIFQRLHPLEEYEGTGIGLAIVRKVAERHGGRAWAESIPGHGATFYLGIPIRSGGTEA